MNIKKSLLTAALALAGLAVSAQGPAEEYEYVFNPHWYGQIQGGVQETLGETKFGDLLAPNAQLAVGYQFSSLFGARLSLNSWQSKASLDFVDPRTGATPDLTGTYKWKWNYIAPMVDATFSLTNFIGGYNPERLVDVNVLAGLGVNIGYKNKEANNINAALSPVAGLPVLRNNWTGTKARFVFRMGAAVDFRVAEAWKIGLELQANVLPDGYNSKKAGNADWYFNGLVGVKHTFGTSFSKQKKVIPVVTETQVIEKIVEVPVEKVVIKEVIKEVPSPLTRDVFFKISTFKITKDEMSKVAEVARYMKLYPDTKVTVTGYADKGTGTMAINLRLSAQRAQVVADTLQKEYGIAADRITVKSMGEAEDQPYSTPQLNRVAICIVE